MNATLLQNWWLLALRGALAIVFGGLAIAWPDLTVLSLALLFAAFALIGGAVWIFAALRQRASDPHWRTHWLSDWLLLLLLGLASLLAGVVAALEPLITMLVLVLLLGANAVVTGVMDIVVAVRVRKFIKGAWLLLLSGAVSCVFGVVVLMFPTSAGVVALALLVGLYALLSGALLLALALRVRKWARLHAGRSSPAAGAV